ncbi:MAG: SpaH/EbpB family LPXTG-anchored major pilin [Leucobacter sp.]|nr:SpaH/EbpB family LPXTG-anchored major pilin [Leucobacter sp.]
MLNFKKRGLLASAGALVTVTALALGGSVAAQAATVSEMPSSSGVIITKLEQPDQPGTPATGLPQTSDLPTISGVKFEAFKVPLNEDPLTNEGQKEIAGTTLEAAKGLTAGVAATRSGVTDAAGQIHWQTAAADDKRDGLDLEAGLWLVRETEAPAGVVPAGDFLLAIPLTHPVDGNTWLDTIYVYPKNHTMEGSKTVENLEEYVVGSTVTWRITIDNPSPRDPATGAYYPADKLWVQDILDSEYLSTPSDGSRMNVVSPAGMTKGADYNVAVDTSGGKSNMTLEFTAQGLEKLSQVPNEKVEITLQTVIVKAGVIENSARFSTSESQTSPKEIKPIIMKYGDYALVKVSEGSPTGTTPSLAGAEFMVFTSEADALAAKAGDQAALDRAAKPAVTVPGYNPALGTWTTNDEGRVDISGLRYSGYADGESFGPGDPRYLEYWLVETKALEGHQLLAEPISFIIDEDSATQTSQTIANQFTRGGFLLPLTGGTGTLLLTIGGIVLLATVLIIARRRQNAAAALAVE